MSQPAAGTGVWVVGSDHAGALLRRAILAELGRLGQQAIDLGHDGPAKVDYPPVAHALGQQVLQCQGRGVLICGSGVGMTIAANRMPGIRAALCAHALVAELSRAHNDANVLCMGEQIVGVSLALAILRAFACTPFAGGRHLRRLAQIDLGLGPQAREDS